MRRDIAWPGERDETGTIPEMERNRSQMSGLSYGKLTGRKRMRRYDFYRPDKFSRENLGALRVLHDNMARLLTSSLSAHVRAAIKVSLIALDQQTYEEFVDQLGVPVILGTAGFEPLEGKVGIEVCPGIAYPLMERLLGSSEEAGIMERELTDIETAVLQTVFEKILSSVEEAWGTVRSVRHSLKSIETSPFFSQFAPPNEMMLVAGFLVEMGNQQDRINVAWPYLMLEPVLQDLSLQHWMGRHPSDESKVEENGIQRETLKQHLDDVRVTVVAELGRSRVSIRDLLELEVGDIVRLERRIEEPIDVCVGERQVLSARVGRSKTRYCVQVK